ncbi:MAG: response regulator transcription factor [Anaerovoracaceae bacterium]|jgi:DNA-binding response OmpR family regulator
MQDEKIKVLVVEDEDSIRRFIKLNLEMAGYEVAEAASGEDALDVFAAILPHVVVLDLMLPGIDGFEVCSYIRNTNPDSLIIMLTAKGQDTDKIMGLELGADDYMVKPFNPFELIARIKAMLRRQNRSEISKSVYVCDNLHLDIAGNRLLRDNREIELTPIEYSLLKLFMENPGKTLKRDEILNEVWGEDYFGDTKTLDVHIRRLREKIEDNPSEPRFIKTVWGFGYRWNSESDGRNL